MFRASIVGWVALLAGSAWGADPQPQTYTGPDAVVVDMLRPMPGGPKTMVQVVLPDGELGMFMVDTGAAISALSEETATRLGLSVTRDDGFVEGLSGRAALHRAVLSEVKIGLAVVPDIEVAVGVPGVPTSMGAIPLDGIFGNNVWSRFVLEMDYPADTLVLHRPGTYKMPRKSDPMFFDGSHVFAPLTLVTASDPPATDRVVMQVDTGANDLMLSGAHGRAFETHYTEGLEPIYGIGAKEFMPPSQFLQITRHVPIQKVTLGGVTQSVEMDAQWINFQDTTAIGPDGLKGLAGQELLQGHVAVFDYRGGRIALRKSKRKPRQLDGHAVLLAQDVEAHGDDPSRYLFRARLQVFLGNEAEAKTLLEAVLANEATLTPDDVSDARVLLAGVRRARGDLAGSREALAPLGPGELVDQDQIVAVVNGLLLDGQDDDAIALAEQGVAERPEASWARVALSDALFETGRYDEADGELIEAARLAQNPDAYLLRRARIALAQGDQYGALAQVRRLLKIYPFEGLYLWFYAELVEQDGAAGADMFRHDLDAAMARLHPTDRPLDYLVAARHSLGDNEEALALMHQGVGRDCSRAPNPASSDNCHAWYYALAGTEPAEALRLIDAALAAEGDRADFLDTKAMVHLARGEVALAHAAALAAARLSPDDVYMLWQAERLGAMLAPPGPTAQD